MITITEPIYRALAQKLLDAVGDSEFFNGSLEYDTDEFYSTLRLTLIIYRDKMNDCSTDVSVIRDIVPVWWELSINQIGGASDHDFSWREFLPYIL